jgi:methionyl-tRNA synthetase
MARGFISTTIPYVNAPPHLGHALEYVEVDAYARHARMRGDDLFVSTGSDENSLKNVIAAERAGMTTRRLVDENVAHFEHLIDDLEIVPQRFVRTSLDESHIRGAVEMWERMNRSGDIYIRAYEGLYCVGCEQFYAESELDHGRCPEHGTVVEQVTEENYFFRLSRYGDRLLAEIESGRLAILPEFRRNEILSLIRGGLDDISISRTADRARGWGIPVPGDPRQVMYVWVDALTNYINALDWPLGEDFARYWDEGASRVHVVGKGVLRFHAVYWPAMLLSAGVSLPTSIVSHGYVTVDGRKIGKSSGNAVNPADLIADFGSDAVRYYLLSQFSPFGDGDFSRERLVSCYNADLANGLGNFVSRTLSMLDRYRDSVVPDSPGAGPAEAALGAQVIASEAGAAAALDRYEHKEAARHLWDLVRRVNAYLNETEPWHLARSARAGEAASRLELDRVLLHSAGVARALGRLTHPFIPNASQALLDVFGDTLSSAPSGERWLEGLGGRRVHQIAALFPRVEHLAPITLAADAPSR